MPSRSLLNVDTVNRLISSIYDASMDGSLWQKVLQDIADTLNSKSGVLRKQNLQANDVEINIAYELDPWFQQQYVDHFIHHDIATAAAADYEAGAVIQTANILPESYRKTEFFNEYVLPQGSEHIAACVLARNEARIVHLAVHRTDRIGHYEQHEIDVLNLLTPHLQRAIDINHHLFNLTAQSDAANNILDRLTAGVVLVDGSGVPLFVNRKAEVMIASGCGMKISKTGVAFQKHEDTMALQDLIYEASMPALTTGGALTVCGPASQPLCVLVAPVNKQNRIDFGFDVSRAAAALFIDNGISEKYDFSLGIIQQLYGLTFAEARLACALANGYSLEAIAGKYGVTHGTLRSQLKACFIKMGVNRQAELVKMILCGPAALVNDGV